MSPLLIRRRDAVAPGIQRWTVGVSWLPRARPPTMITDTRRAEAQSWQLLDRTPTLGRDEATALLETVMALLMFIVNALASLVAVIVLLVARVLFRRPWVVQARGEQTTLEWEVVGWRATQRLIDDAAGRLDRGESLDDLPAPS